MHEADLDQVMAIETDSFSLPWSRKNFEVELKKEFCFSIVALTNYKVVGYLIVWLVADEIHIANIAVHYEWRRHGIAEMLMRIAIQNSKRFSWMGLEVRRTNRAARALYTKLGFIEVGERKNYYQLEGEDAILMAKVLKADSC